MKRHIAIFLGLIIITSVSCNLNNKVKIFVAWPGASYLPGYDWKEGESKPTGVEPALVERILEIAGYEYTYIANYNYNRGGDVRIDVITDGVADIAIRSITINDERKEKVNFSEPYYFDGISALVLKDSDIRTKEDLVEKTVYAFDHTTAFTWANKNLQESKIVSYKDFPQKHLPQELLLNRKIDAYLGDRTFLKTLTSQSPQYKVIDETYTREPFGIAVHKEKTQLLNDINSAIEKLRKTGELEKLTSIF